MNNSVFGKTMENVRKHRDIKFVTTENIRNYLLSESNYHTTKFFTHLLAIEMKKAKKQKPTTTEIRMNKPVLRTFNTRKYSCMSFGIII